jgi:hypothetical protein
VEPPRTASSDSRKLTDRDFAAAARALNVPVAAVRAVAHVESAGSGFLPDGRPTILYEAHIFDRLTKGKHRDHKDSRGLPISTTQWNRKNYGQSGEYQYHRLELAAALDFDAAHEATSWGMFQIMGMNWKAMNYNDVGDFLHCMSSAAGQLDGFVRFIRINALLVPLQDRDWAEFARRYNGPGYAKNAYDAKLAAAYERFRNV